MEAGVSPAIYKTKQPGTAATTESVAVNELGHLAWLAANRKTNRPATNRAIFNQRLFGLQGVDLHRKNFAAMRTSDFRSDD